MTSKSRIGASIQHRTRRTQLHIPKVAMATFVIMASITGGELYSQATTSPRFTIEEVLAAPFPYELVAAKRTDRIAWIEYEAGRRNVYTATGPEYRRERLTTNELDDGIDLEVLQISDDGSVIVFIRGHTPNREGWIANPTSDPEGARREVWAVRTMGGEPWRLAETRTVSLAPDGSAVTYIDDGQIYLVPLGSSGERGLGEDDSEPLFRVFGQVREVVWSPDSRRLAFTTYRESHSFIGVFDLEQRTVRYLAPGVDYDQSPTWSGDGTKVAFVRTPGRPFGFKARSNSAGRNPSDRLETLSSEPRYPPGLVEPVFSEGHEVEIWVANAESGAGERLWRPAPDDSAMAQLRRITWVGDHLLFRLEPGEWQRYYSLSTSRPASGPVALTHEEGMPEEIATSPDGKHLFFASNHGDIDRRHIWRVPLAGGRAEQITSGSEIETFPVVLASGNEIAYLRASAREPLGLVVRSLDRGGSTREVLTHPASFPSESHIEPENLVLTAADGLEFHNQLFLPPDLEPGERRPALIFIHGGPRRQMLLGYNYGHFYHMAYAMNQYFANRGYIVVSINYRGGIGYGKSFRDAPDRGRYGNSEYQDLRALGEYLQGRPDVDPERIGLWGLSYGGILTAQGLARDSEIFAAGVDIAGVHSWGDPLDPESVAHQASSISSIERWRSPVLLIHGDDDRNVAFSQTVGLVQLLRAHAVPYELIVFPDEVHTFLIHENWLRTFEATDDFFQRTLIEGRAIEGGVAATSTLSRGGR